VRHHTSFAPGWQRHSGTPITPVTAAAPGDAESTASAEPEPIRLNGFTTLSFHVGCGGDGITLAAAGGVATGVLWSFCFGDELGSIKS
jgi:hypothetical protein